MHRHTGGRIDVMHVTQERVLAPFELEGRSLAWRARALSGGGPAGQRRPRPCLALTPRSEQDADIACPDDG